MRKKRPPQKAAATNASDLVRGIIQIKIGGADGVRTHDLLDAIEARSQLRHGPTERTDLF